MPALVPAPAPPVPAASLGTLAIYCTRCGELAALATLPAAVPVAPADARFVLRQAARLLTRSLPVMRSVLELAIAGNYTAALREIQNVYDGAAARGGDTLICGPCVHADRVRAAEEAQESPAAHTVTAGSSAKSPHTGEPSAIPTLTITEGVTSPAKPRRIPAKVTR